MAMSALSAATLYRDSASATTVSTSTASKSGRRSPPCSRDSSISSPTMLASRMDSASIFSANRRTVSASSAEASSASASTPIAPTGVLSSCLPFGRRQIALDVLTGGQRALRRLPGPVVEQAVAHQAQLPRPVVGVDDVTVGVDHHDAHRRQRDNVLQHFRHGD